MPPAGFEPTTSAGEPPQTHALGCLHTNRVESSRVESSRVQFSQTLESLGVHTDRVESNQVCASSSALLVLFEQWTIKEL